MIETRSMLYNIFIKDGEVVLRLKLKDKLDDCEHQISLSPCAATELSRKLEKWANAANKPPVAKAVVDKQKFYTLLQSSDERKQEEANVRKEVANLEHCSQCGELFMDTFSCGITHGIIKHQKGLVRQWDARAAIAAMDTEIDLKDAEILAVEGQGFTDWSEEAPGPWGNNPSGFVDPMSGMDNGE